MMASSVVVTLGEPEVVVMEADPVDREGEILRGANSDGEELVIDAQVEEATQSDVTRGERRRTEANAMIGSGCDDDAAVMNVVETASNFNAEDELRTAEGGDGDGDGMVISSRDTAECDSNYFSEDGFEDSSRVENLLCCARESCTAPEDDGDDANAHTSLRLIEVNILGLELLVEGFDSSYVKTQCHDEIRSRLTRLVEELRELSGQIADEDGKLLFTMETSPDEASCPLKSDNQSVEKSKEGLNVAAKLHLALEQLQKSTKQKLLPSVDVEGIEPARDKPKSSRDDADVLQLEQQLQDLADENTRLANRVEESSQVIENLWTKEAQVKGETAALVQELQRRKVEILQELGLVNERVDAQEEAKEECTSVIEDLKRELQRLQEENTGLKSVFNESSQVTQGIRAVSSSVAAEFGKLKGEDLESIPEFEILRGESQSIRKESSTLGSKAASPKEVEDCKIMEVVDQCFKSKRQLNKLDNDRAHIITRMKGLELSLVHAAGEKAWLQSQLDSVLEEKQKRAEELVENLQKSQECVHTMEAEKKELLSQIDELTISLRRMEEEKNSLATRFDEHSQALQDALVEKVWLADKVSKLEQEIQSSESKFLGLTSELQNTQYHLTASIKCEQLVVSELKQNKEEREEENLKHSSNLQELQVQLQALREENTHVVIKASKLDQLVEELKSDKLRLGSNLELLVRDGQRREQELRSDLGTWMEQVQRLEAEKLTSVTLVDNLNTQVRRLVEDNERLMGVSSETSQSLQRLWEENRQFIEELNKLEQEKLAQEGEKMELVAGLQEIWEQLQAANNREADIVSELKSLSERREFEEYTFIEKVKGLEQQLQDLEQQLQSICDEKADISTRFVETTKVLEEFRQETLQRLSEMLEAKVLLENEVVQLMKMKQELEEDNAREQTALYNQVQGLESEKAESLSTIEDLNGRVCASEEEIKDHVEQIAKLKQFIQELREENTRLGGEINKLEEVKERHEGERLELASELQAAWDQIQAVRESEANLATELSEVKELRAEEKVRFDGLLQELQLQLKEVMEQKIQSGMKVEELTKRLHELQKEQDLQDENGRLVSELSLLEQEKEKLALEGATLFRETQTLRDHVQTLEVEKNTLASEVEELNQWLQKPAAEKRQLASKLDEMTHSVQRLELEKMQLSTTVIQLQDEKERKHDELERLNTIVMSLEEEKSELVAAHELMLRQLQSLQGTNLQMAMMHEHVEISNEKVHILEEESKSMASLLDNAQVQLQALEDERTQLENLMEGRTALANEVQLENSQLVSDARKRDQELEVWQAERQLLKTNISNLEQEVVRLVEEDLMHKQELVELKEQFKCVIEVKDNHAEELKTDLEQCKQLLTRIEGKETHLLWEVHDCREELQKLNLDKTERVPNLCQDLDSLLRNVGEEREKVAREHGLCLENRNLVSDLCGQLDDLLQRVREEKLKVAVDLSTSKHQIRESRSFMEDKSTLGLDKDRQQETVLASENGDTCIDMEALKQMLQGCLEEKLRLEKDVTRLSLSLEESQSQLQVLTTRHSTKNPQLHTKVQGWEDSQNFDQDDDSFDMALPIHSIDDKYVTNYVREVEAKAYGKALDDPLDQGPDSPAWFKKENCRTTTMDSYLQVHSMELLQQEKDAAIYAEEVARAKLESLLLHLGKAEKGNNDLAIVVEELKDECSVLKQENSILIDKLVKVSEGSSLAAARISTLTSELKERILKFEEEESDFRVQIAREERERDSTLVAAQECDFMHCDIAQKAQEDLGRLRSDLTKLLQEYETLTCQGDYDSKQLKVPSVEKSDLLAHVCLLKKETCSDVDKNEIVSSLSAEVSPDFEAPKLVTETKSLEPGTPHQRHRNVVMEKNIEAVADRLESSMSDVFCNTSLGSTLTVSCSCDILDSLHRILLREISSTRRHLEQVQTELMEHKQHFANFQGKLESSVLLLFPETLVTRSNGIGRLYELSDFLINVLLRECSKTSDKLQPHQLAEVEILMEKAALIEKDKTNNVGPIGSEKDMGNCNMAALISPSEDANLIVDLSNMNKYALQSTVKEAMDLKDLIPKENKGELSTLLSTMDHTVDVDEEPQLESSGEVGEESESKLVLQRAMQTIKSLESELEFKKRVASNLQEYLLERNSYIQLLEATFDKYNWPDDYPVSAPVVDKIEWFGKVLACTEDTVEKLKEQMEVPGVNCESHNPSKESLVAKLAAFGKEVEKEEPERDAVLGVALQKIELLESELEFKKSVSANLQEYLLERNSYIQLLEATVGKYNWPHDYPVSAPLVDKIEYFGKVLACTEVGVEKSQEEMEIHGVKCESHNSSKEVLVAKLAAFGKEVENEEPERDAVLKQALQKIESLEGELEFKKSVSANLQEYLLERNSYIQLLETTVGKFNWPHDYPVSAPLVDKIEYFGKVLACTEVAAGNPKEQMEVLGGNCEPDISSKEVLVAKLAAFGKEVEKEEPERDAVLGEALQKIELLESELEFKKSVSANLQEYLLERNSYIQLLEATVGKYNWPHDYPVSAPLVDKIEYFGKVLACTEVAVEKSQEEMEIHGVKCESHNSSKEVLVAKLAAFGKEVENEEPERDAVLGEALQQIELLESELEFKKSVSANLQEYLLERNSYIQLLEATVGKYNWPHDYPVSAPLVDKIEYFGKVLACTEVAAGNPKEQMEVLGGNCEPDKSSKEVLVAKLAAFGKEVEKEEPERDAVLGEALQQIELLESELEFKKSVSANLQEYLLERNSYIQLLETTVGKFNWPHDYPVSAPLVDKIEYFGKVLACTEVAAGNPKEQMEVLGGNCEPDKSSKEVLVAKLAAFGKEVEKEEPERDAVLGEALQQIELLESELEFKKSVSANLQEYLLERNSYIQLLEATVGKYNWPHDYPVSAPLVDKIEYFGKVLAYTEDAVGNPKEQMEVLGGNCEPDKSSKEVLVAKLAAFGKEVEKEEPERDAVLGEALQQIELLESELEFKKSVSANLQEYLLERNSYIQLLETTVGKYNWPHDYPVSAPLVEKIEWLSKFVASSEDAAGSPKEQMEVPGGNCEPDKSSKEVLVAKLAAFGKEVEKEEPERDAVLVPQESWEELQYPYSVSSPFDSETKSKKRSFLSVSKESLQEVEATFRKFSWPNGYPANAPVCGKIEWLARFFVPPTSAVARESLDYNPTLPDGMSETTTPVRKKMAVRHATMVERSAEKLDSNATSEQVQERLTSLQDQRTSLESEMDATKVCSCSRGSSLEETSLIQPVEGALEKCVWPNDHISPATLTDQVEWLAEAFSAMKPEVVRKSMGAETAEIFLTKLSYVTGLREALAGDRSFMASPTDSKYSQSGSALIGSPMRIVSMRDMTSISKNEDDTTEYELTSLQQSLEVMDYKELLESTFQKFSWPNDYPSTAALVNKIEWLGQNFGVREARSNDSQTSDSAELETVGQLGSYIAAQDVVAVGNCNEAETILKSIPAEVDCADVVHENLVVLEKRIRALEGELDFKRDVSSGLLQSLMERNSYIQAIEVAVGKFDWPEGYPSGGSLMDKIEWLGSTFTAVEGIGDIEEEKFMASGNSGDPESSMELFLALKETLVAKQAAFTRQASREKYEKDAALRQTRDTIADLESTISVLENDLEYNRGVSSGLQESLVESNGYIQMVEGVLGKFNWPGDYPLTESLSNKIQWLGETFGSVKQGISDEANEKTEKRNGENDFYTPSKEVLAAKLVALTTQFSEQKSERDVALLEAHKRIVAMEKSIVSLESELEVKKGVSSALQQSLLEENRYIQMVEGTLDKCCWPDDYPSTAPLNGKIEWLVEHLALANEELGTHKQLAGEINSRLSELSEKTVFLNTELSCVNREKEALTVKYAVLADKVIEEISGRDAALQEANERVGAMQGSINVLEGKFEQERKLLCDLQRCFQEKSIQLDLVDDAVSKLVYLEEFPSAASLNDQIMWLANTFISTQQEVDRLRTSSDLMSTALEELHRKADSYCVEKEVLEMKLRELLGNEQLVCTLQKTLSSQELELAELSKKVKEVAEDMSAQETENQSLLQEGRTHAELEDAKRDKDALKLEVSQMDQKLSSAREELGVVVSEGQLIEKERDSLKQALEEKITELESSNIGHIQSLQVKDAELLDIKLKLEQSEEQCELFVSALQEALVESSFPADLNSMEPLDIIDWLVLEYVHGKETISLWMKRAEDSEKQVVANRVKYESDLEDTIKELSDIKLKLEQSEDQRRLFVSALQEALLESSLPADLNSMEPLDVIDWLVVEYVHGKETISLWMKQAEDSGKQVVAERVKYESDLEDTIKELQDIKLKLEQSEEQCELFVSALQEALVESSLPADLNSREPLDIIDWLVREHVHGKESISLWMKRAEDSEKQVVADRVKYESHLEDTIQEAMSHSSNFSIRLEELEDIIQQKDNSLRTMEIAQVQAATKCSDLVEQLKESRRQCDVLAAEVDKLPETLRNKENDIIRLQDEAALMAGSSAAHVQSFREVSLDVGEESDDFFIDPRHGFKTLVNSRNIPNATRSVANQFDLLCFGAGRLFMRQPMARLALAAYWIFIHVWMAYFSLSATKYTKITHL